MIAAKIREIEKHNSDQCIKFFCTPFEIFIAWVGRSERYSSKALWDFLRALQRHCRGSAGPANIELTEKNLLRNEKNCSNFKSLAVWL